MAGEAQQDAENMPEQGDALDLGDIRKAVPSGQSLSNDPDPKTQLEQLDYEAAARYIELKSRDQDIRERKEYAKKIFELIVWWLGAVWFLLMLAAIGGPADWFILSDKVLITLIGGTTVNVLGIFVIVANYLFNKDKTKSPPR